MGNFCLRPHRSRAHRAVVKRDNIPNKQSYKLPFLKVDNKLLAAHAPTQSCWAAAATAMRTHSATSSRLPSASNSERIASSSACRPAGMRPNWKRYISSDLLSSALPWMQRWSKCASACRGLAPGCSGAAGGGGGCAAGAAGAAAGGAGGSTGGGASCWASTPADAA